MSGTESSMAASKFVASLVKSLQIICTGDVNFSECVELVGYINVRIDHRLKFDYIVNEQVCRDKEDASATCLSNSYHSSPPTPNLKPKSGSAIATEDEVSYNPEQPENIFQETLDQALNREKSIDNVYSVKVQNSKSQANHMVVKLEGGDDSNDCMVLPTSAGGFENLDDVSSEDVLKPSQPAEAGSGDTEDRKESRKTDKDPNEGDAVCEPVASFENKDNNIPSMEITGAQFLPSLRAGDVDTMSSTSHYPCPQKVTAGTENPQNVSKNHNNENTVADFKRLIAKLTFLCDLPVVQSELFTQVSKETTIASENDIRSAKKRFFNSFSKENLKKLKEAMKLKKGKPRTKRLRAVLSESGFSNEKLLQFAQESSLYPKNSKHGNAVDPYNKLSMYRDRRRQMRSKTQERQQKLLEMAEMLKKNQTNEPGITVITKSGDRKCALQKSSVSVVSHSSLYLSVDNIDEVSEALTGKSSKSFILTPKTDIKDQGESRKCGLKKKMKQIVGKMLSDVNEAGYHVVVSSTVGSETGSHSSDLQVVPLKVDDFLPEVKECEAKPELTEEEYAKQLEREQILEKQKASKEKMKDIEGKLMRILSGAEEIFVTARKRYGPGDARPSDAERMKEYRKRLKQNPEKYQIYKQKRVMNTKWRRLGQLAAKVKVNSSNSTVTVIPASVNEDSHSSQSMSALVSMNQTVGSVNMHCPQVFKHPNTHQPPASVVSDHHSNQFVGPVPAIHPTHPPQPISYGNDMEFVDLIAASHSVQNQHFG